MEKKEYEKILKMYYNDTNVMLEYLINKIKEDFTNN